MNAALARWIYFTSQSLRGEPVQSVLQELEVSQHWPVDRLLQLQWDRQVRLARHAYDTTPFYKHRWREAGISPDDLRSREDWRRLPIVEKATVQERGKEMISSRAPAGLEAATSGSSGTPVKVLRSHISWAHVHANKFRQLRWHGLQVGDPYAYFWGLALDETGRRRSRLKDLLFNRERCSAFELDRESAGRFYEKLRKNPVLYGYGYPSALATFAEEISALGLDGRALRWKAVIGTAEVLHPSQRERMAEVFGCAVADDYGCAEAGDAGIECERGGLHVPVESVVVDVVPTPEGRQEILITDLHNDSQPLIRYRVGDLVDPPETSRCPCGRGLPLLGRPYGRAGDVLTMPDGRRINANLPSYIFKHHGSAGTVREYQFVQFPEGRVELRVTAGPAWSDAVRPQLAAEVRETLGIDVDICVVPRFERRGRGKHRDFVKAEDLEE